MNMAKNITDDVVTLFSTSSPYCWTFVVEEGQLMCPIQKNGTW